MLINSGLGFGALPAGNYNSNNDNFNNEGNNANFWSSTEYSSDRAYGLRLDYDLEDARVGNDGKYRAFSVRCVKN